MIFPATVILSGIFFLPVQKDSKEADRPQASAPEVRLTLRSDARIRGHEILLGDLARIETRDREFADTLADIRLGRAPRGRWARWIGPREIREALVRHGVRRDKVTIFGAQRVQVSSIQERIEPEVLLRTAESTLRALLRDEGETDATWEPLSRPAPAIVPAGRRSSELVAQLPTGRLQTASAFFRVDVKIDGETVTSVPVSFRIHRYREALVVVRPIRKGDPVGPDSLTTRRIDVAGRAQPSYRFAGEVSGLVAARDLRPGTILSPSDLSRPALVRRGDQVTVVSISGKVRITTQGIAQRDGSKDQVIPVRIGARPAPIFARVYGTGIVLVTPPARRVFGGTR